MTARAGWQARVVDAAAVAVAGLAALGFAGEAENSGRVVGDALFWMLVLAGAGAVALWWRRRHPVGVALALVPVAAVTDLAGVAVLVAVYTVAASRRWAVTLAVAGLHAVVVVPVTVVLPDPDLTVPGSLTIHAALLSIAVAVGAAVRARGETVASLRERAARAEAEAERHADRQRMLERERIAREMHDALAHRISLVSLHAGALEIRTDLSTQEVARAAGTIRASAHQALADLREILGVLRRGSPEPGGDDLAPQPGLAALDALVAECRSAGTAVEVDNRMPGTQAPPSVSRTAYRVVQEGLTNARKHAPGAPVRLRIDRTPAGELHIWLHNRLAGPQAPAVPGSRCGLVGLTERASLAGGRLDHGIRRGPGGDLAFHLEAWLPWPA